MAATTAALGVANLPSTSTGGDLFSALLAVGLIAAAAAYFFVARRRAA